MQGRKVPGHSLWSWWDLSHVLFRIDTLTLMDHFLWGSPRWKDKTLPTRLTQVIFDIFLVIRHFDPPNSLLLGTDKVWNAGPVSRFYSLTNESIPILHLGWLLSTGTMDIHWEVKDSPGSNKLIPSHINLNWPLFEGLSCNWISHLTLCLAAQ